MIRIFSLLIGLLFPVLALAQNESSSALTFAPPATDYSIVFLSNIFGVVDGVLHGTGSQILGAMFAVFNSAVLALGGIIIMYTLIVSTLNTAHEGEMLGKQWSSIWIPMRSTVGLALMIPKASGYCIMQIFVMWIVVQGVGAADKVWDGALSYLNRGGVIIQAQSNPTEALTNQNIPGIFSGAMNILTGQVCMTGLQKTLEAQRESYLQAKQHQAGPCSGTPSKTMQTFCDTSVPDMVNSVNIVAFQTSNPNNTSFTVNMPNLDSNSPYSFLNGICGSISWNAYNSTRLSSIKSNIKTITSGEIQTIQMSRAIAIQQVYMDLSNVAQVMVNNDPQLVTTTQNSGTENFSNIANTQFGIPYTANNAVCTSTGGSAPCVMWGAASGSSSAPLFNGTEFLNAINDYNGIMAPTLNLYQQSQQAQQSNSAREFIQSAQNSGWAMAGSYFFDLVRINGSATANNRIDSDSGLDNSQSEPNTMLSAFSSNGTCSGQYALLCTWFNRDSSKISNIVGLINGTSISSTPVSKPELKKTMPKRYVVDSALSSTVYGFVNNAVMIQLPGQPGIDPQFQFANLININLDGQQYSLPSQSFSCGEVKIVMFKFCMGQMLGNLFYNNFIRYLYNFLMNIFQQTINQLILAFLVVPLQGMSEIFKQGIMTLSEPGVNPVVALANMGIMYINFSANIWLMLISMSLITMIIPVFGAAVMALITLCMPLFMAWVGTMVTIGFSTAYYVPLLPYMIFTFGTIAWLTAVVEAIVAAPIVALGITHPEGQHQVFGKGENSIMILLNIFLRPSMMIIGYIVGIMMTYVSVWILNAGFEHAISFMQTPGDSSSSAASGFTSFGLTSPGIKNPFVSHGSYATHGYTEWAGIYAYFFAILSYTTMYLIVVQKSFNLIYQLPDKVLRWIGGQAETVGQEISGWGEEAKGISKEAGQGIQTAQGQIDKQLGGYAEKAKGKGVQAASDVVGQAGGGGSTSIGPDSSPPPPPPPPGPGKS